MNEKIKAIWDKKINAKYPCENHHYLRLSPYVTNTDGFFMAIIEKK